jgi:protein tyrosine phosphatase (PTP) superfamily phosphohydrolase (DUF442 family)
MSIPHPRLLAVSATIFLALGCGQQPQPTPANAVTQAPPANQRAEDPAAAAPAEPVNAAPEKVAAEHLPNPWRLHPNVISGGLPEGDAAFKELADLGVKTVISVDGAKPDVATAKKYGLRYVHMPHGYDGVPEQRAKELAKAVRDLPGPIYIHCHHGKHRSPAAATIACVGAGLLSPDAAVGVLKAAGTSENYRGLYQSAEAARKLDDALLTELQVEYPESVKVPPIADAMIDIEHTHDHLKSLAANEWARLEKQPDLDSAHEALLLREHYTELLRTDEIKQQPEGFQKMLAESETAAQTLETLLAEWKKAGSPVPPSEEIGKAFATVTQSCTACHKTYRDVPLGEKGK